ncbi:plasmid pRiA4b ORF-3 family protein [Fundidesulfovibrio terrae]|uniref:plasmid pRiA4b ORF-3 family protein n=1 Tax=Fundidesulfovibrio terrae TaxID=2922866 RepID=UPI001FB0360B|nr:plasmid pRiA4b ORF-3 family protein [Fundidesulfovibrio terrae]
MIYQLHVQLLGITPLIWRRIQVPGEVSLFRLNLLIQRAMGWKNTHLSEFNIDSRKYGATEQDHFAEGVYEFKKFKLSQVVTAAGQSFLYAYDFGDDWLHKVVVEDILARENEVKYPLCIAGERACPPEDVGGIYGYDDFLEAISDPKHESHADYKTWIKKFDPENFDVDKATKAMQRR